MRFVLWTAFAWLVMASCIIAIDVGQAAFTGDAASHDITRQDNFTPDQGGLLDWVERISRGPDEKGHQVFGRFAPLAELLIYGGIAPLLIAGPVGWEARQREWSPHIGGWIGGSAGLLIVVWSLSKPELSSVYHALVSALLLCCRVFGLSYHNGSFVYFLLLPPACIVAYVGVRSTASILQAGGD